MNGLRTHTYEVQVDGMLCELQVTIDLDRVAEAAEDVFALYKPARNIGFSNGALLIEVRRVDVKRFEPIPGRRAR
jgi:hypothetical protein